MESGHKQTEPPTADLCSLPITFENCYEVLAEAKRVGAARAEERAYRFMSDHYLQVLRRRAAFGRLSAAERELILARRTEGGPVLAVAETGEASEAPATPDDGQRRRVLVLAPGGRRWEELTRLPEEIPARGCGMCTLYNYLFVAGGVCSAADGRCRASERVFCFNPLTRAWSETRPLTQARSQLRLVAADGHLYAIGGECLLAVERYDPSVDRWTPVAPLPRGSFAVAHEATACGGQLFVSGGSLFYRLLRYDARRDEWEECPFNESRRRSTDMVAHGSCVYRFDVERERASVCVYKYNTLVKAWHEGARFPLENPLPFRCAPLGNRIYCVNRSQTLQFEVLEDRESFLPEILPAPDDARGALVPFVLMLSRDPGTHEPGPDAGPKLGEC